MTLMQTNIYVKCINTDTLTKFYHFNLPLFIENLIGQDIEVIFNEYQHLSDQQVILYKDAFKLCYLVNILFDSSNEQYYMVILGPFLNEIFTMEEIRYYGNQMKLSSENIHILENFFSHIPFYSQDQIRDIFTLLTNTLRNHLMEIELVIADTPDDPLPQVPFSNKFNQYDFVEKNYAMENKMLKAIETGDVETLQSSLKSFSKQMSIPKRQQYDPLRNVKNLSITLNSISARAAMKGGLNPHLAHSMSTRNAIEIERQKNIEGLNKLNQRILTEYCQNVRKYAFNDYSKLVIDAIIYIRKNLTRTVNLQEVSQSLHTSREHLSRTFKKETGQSITDFIHRTKVEESLELIRSKTYSINQIAELFGYSNASYYSTVFKKVMGISPREYADTST